ncbi:hypothetical protein ANN_16879 [Periplaneta americana]|uniref:Uncharacterized protein n=1 Tax=Periplaneta americana TaxID=6978 RepID=A0ABQ8SSU7_PERAM|nr:hypothetical protein ANN_16879 [Periplaneta americana]
MEAMCITHWKTSVKRQHNKRFKCISEEHLNRASVRLLIHEKLPKLSSPPRDGLVKVWEHDLRAPGEGNTVSVLCILSVPRATTPEFSASVVSNPVGRPLYFTCLGVTLACSEILSAALTLLGRKFQSRRTATVKEDEYEDVRWEGMDNIEECCDRVSRSNLISHYGQADEQVGSSRRQWAPSSRMTINNNRANIHAVENLADIAKLETDEVTGEWRKLHNAELDALYSSPDMITNIKCGHLRRAGHVARMGESRNAYRVLVGRPERKRPLGRPRRRWDDNIKMDLRDVGYDDRDLLRKGTDGRHM